MSSVSFRRLEFGAQLSLLPCLASWRPDDLFQRRSHFAHRLRLRPAGAAFSARLCLPGRVSRPLGQHARSLRAAILSRRRSHLDHLETQAVHDVQALRCETVRRGTQPKAGAAAAAGSGRAGPCIFPLGGGDGKKWKEAA